MFSLPKLSEAVRRFCQDNLPGRTPLYIRIYTSEDEKHPMQFPVVGQECRFDNLEDAFVPNAFQQAILVALEGKGLRTDALAAKVGDRSRLFSKPRGGISELKEHGLIGHHDRVGYYSIQAPPPELAGQE